MCFQEYTFFSALCFLLSNQHVQNRLLSLPSLYCAVPSHFRTQESNCDRRLAEVRSEGCARPDDSEISKNGLSYYQRMKNYAGSSCVEVTSCQQQCSKLTVLMISGRGTVFWMVSIARNFLRLPPSASRKRKIKGKISGGAETRKGSPSISEKQGKQRLKMNTGSKFEKCISAADFTHYTFYIRISKYLTSENDFIESIEDSQAITQKQAVAWECLVAQNSTVLCVETLKRTFRRSISEGNSMNANFEGGKGSMEIMATRS